MFSAAYRGAKRKHRSPFGAQLDQILDHVFQPTRFSLPDRGGTVVSAPKAESATWDYFSCGRVSLVSECRTGLNDLKGRQPAAENRLCLFKRSSISLAEENRQVIAHHQIPADPLGILELKLIHGWAIIFGDQKVVRLEQS